MRYNSLLRSKLNKEQEIEGMRRAAKLSSSTFTQDLEYFKLEETNKDYQVQLLNAWPATFMFLLTQDTSLKLFPAKSSKSRIK